MWLLADVHRLSQIVINLVSNAVKFTKQGTINISAKTEQSEDSTEMQLHISVQDTGIGMNSDGELR